MGYICTRCGGTNVACEAIVNPNTGKIIDYFDGSFAHAICGDCENENKIFILGTRKTGCDLIMLGGTNCNEITMDRVFGCLGNEKFYVCQPISLYKTQQNIQERPALYVFKIATAYFREQGLVPVFEDCHCKLMKL